MKPLFYLFFLFFPGNIFCQWSTAQLSAKINCLTGVSSEKKVYFGGGYINWRSYNKTVDIYDPATDSWSKDQLSKGRAFLTSVYANGKVFFAGGEDIYSGNGYRTSSIVDIYDEQTNAWSVENLSEGRAWLSAVHVGSKILFAGGMKEVNIQEIKNNPSDVVDIYDLQTGEWSTAKLSKPRAFIASAVNGNLAFFAGGWPVTDIIDIYNSETNEWTTDKLSVARGQAAGASVGNLVLFAGGGLAASFTPSDVVDIYDVVSQKWSTAKLSKARGELLATTIGEKVYFVGGSTIDQIKLVNGTAFFNHIDIYDHATGQWSTDRMQEKRVNHAVTSLENKLYVGGGDAGPHLVYSNVEIFSSTVVGQSEESLSKAELNIFPNPASDLVNISFNNARSEELHNGTLLLFDTFGRLVKKGTFTKIPTLFPLRDIPKGLYLIKLSVGDEFLIKKIIVQ